ncbi:CPBP family intramembrane metalloprotease [Chlorobium phaeovibrioides]|uniref:CPBP family intramembrane metalloprotease n=2 Tax=Chlorobium phaeovibrioides TaxID=1094 RepID=A0A3S0U0Z1_CHLPH|nr:CPBP family intramembrane metalloprotease [Chlorobium phaeovibrioides]QEQ57792.1 CPBP family intramembrane metalloprotease [Chlorobium phaeovibrioides]RTY36852.1 CPBP family intramembrane metalloprotease [Chlorobium phaeovibrioides]HCD36228.1 CPBP family intramembrane metalloprotease domain-containing protein [Chlorobium sp.]
MLPDRFTANRPSFFINTAFLLGVMVLYPVAGALLFSLSGGSAEMVLVGGGIGAMLPKLRFVQVLGQLLVLALPVLVLAAVHVRRRLFSPESFRFLGLGGGVDSRLAWFGVAGVFLLQPLLYTVAGLQNLFLWPALGEAGAEVVRQRAVMEGFISELAGAGSLSEFFVVVGVLALVPAVSEELLFRGYVQGNYAASMRPLYAVLLTGTMFAFFHMSAANLVPLALLGYYIGYIYSRSGNLAVPMSVHFVNNLSALLLLALGGGSEAAGPEPELLLGMAWWWAAVPLSLLLFVFVMRRFSSIASAS